MTIFRRFKGKNEDARRFNRGRRSMFRFKRRDDDNLEVMSRRDTNRIFMDVDERREAAQYVKHSKLRAKKLKPIKDLRKGKRDRRQRNEPIGFSRN